MKQKPSDQLLAAAKFATASGILCLLLAAFVAHNLGERLRLVAIGLVMLGWGSKKKLERRGFKQFEKLDKAGSVDNVLKMLSWFFLLVIVTLVVFCGYLFFLRRRQ